MSLILHAKRVDPSLMYFLRFAGVTATPSRTKYTLSRPNSLRIYSGVTSNLTLMVLAWFSRSITYISHSFLLRFQNIYYLIIIIIDISSFFLRLRSFLSLFHLCRVLLDLAHDATVFTVNEICIWMVLKLVFDQFVDFHLFDHLFS